MCTHLLLRELQKCNSLLNKLVPHSCQFDRRMLDLIKKNIPPSRAKEKPQQVGSRGKPHACQRCLEGSKKPCVYRDLEVPQRERKTCLWVF